MAERKHSSVESIPSFKEDFPSLPLDANTLQTLVEDAQDWAHANGLVMRSPSSKSSSDSCIHAPFSLLPAPFPAALYRQALQVQDATARLYHRIAYDTQWLLDAHKDVVKTDEFTRNLCDILKKVTDEGLSQRKTLVIQRSDYMSHKDPFTSEYTLKQVEVNNIASSMGGHSERVSSLHRRVLALLGMEPGRIQAAIPHNKPITMIARALFLAWKEYGREDGVILVIVEDVNQNQIDQRHVEYELAEQGVNPALIKRMTLTQCEKSLSLDSSRHLLLDGATVSVVYFRAGYSPDHYHSQKEWDARLTIERADAIKAPWIGLQVANTKKVQQVLAEDGQLELFISDFAEAASVRKTFAGLWPLDGSDPVAEKIIKHAQAKPEGYVLKPQLEGGGGNFYGDEVRDKLLHATPEERSAFILMEKLRPLVIESYLVRAHQPTQLVEAVSELGVYGYAFGDDADVPVVATGGSLLRTKGKLVDEGGVAVGAAVIDSPFLYEFRGE
ncbi:hypothetical protein PFISCL1PPCAC_8132 [Pristionchus fissidentatus]|uniref:Glutathione synthetase n=1 Tax=Pristionchus fissidentatus TaxID=1538716 RepID=A0AAV5VAZ1_9BILA|nr:hypothetical protein PFISCL1PPCAC_8132 [Pristionchus fissidentatus]